MYLLVWAFVNCDICVDNVLSKVIDGKIKENRKNLLGGWCRRWLIILTVHGFETSDFSYLLKGHFLNSHTSRSILSTVSQSRWMNSWLLTLYLMWMVYVFWKAILTEFKQVHRRPMWNIWSVLLWNRKIRFGKMVSFPKALF